MKLIKSFLFLSCIAALTACSPEKSGNQSGSGAAASDWFIGHENDAVRFAEMYPVSPEHPFIIASYEELITHLNWGTGVIVFAFPICPRCRNAFPVLEQAFKEMDMERYAGLRGRILYYDIFDDREANNERYQTIVSYLKDFLPPGPDGNPRIFSPHVFFLASGKIVGNHLDTVPSLTNPRDPLNEEQHTELLQIYKDLIEKVEDCEC